ncbi:malate dehydrogenase [Mucisphaera calidilacus]|uniref:L-lactate dehydrogenase n=1 Tax=Mucisphaera calidilacus TaxID=2527982 RepID=A0A518BYF2_9BACT|nr:lactate/malate dehydrogenase family protein [Mucisphaera calidilacus]QDU72007.1 L-lactate dehydrogenase [Mucisphaera calidilacus]
MSIKVAIVGGAGRVGSNAAYALQCGGIVRDIALVDVNHDAAQGEALDLLHGSSIIADQRIHAANLSEVADADVVCITAGSRRKPDESRLDLINRNVSIFRGILDGLRDGGLSRDAILFVVSNPVDVLTRLAVEYLDWNPQRVMGLGTVLDTARFRSMIAEAKNLPPTQVKALILGEHGDSMSPIWSSATVGGIALTELLTPNEQQTIFERTKGSGAEVIRRKGGAGYAVGLSILEVIHSIALDSRQILPVSTRMSGQYGLQRVCLSIPTVVGREGVVGYHDIKLWPKELAGLQRSSQSLDQTFAQLK